ncbi:hypothetical protein [Agrobacterium rosae]|uniref:hypothetical protein n=1 Tax=Agrobacterium rosae TaxID=1972867 RepID=UPI003B9F399F
MSVMVDKMSARRGGPLAVVGQVLLVSLVAIIGWNIALPGLDPVFLETQSRAGGASALSILALGVWPILTALALGQIVRLIIPRLADSKLLVAAENVGALLLAGSQAYGIALSFSAMGRLTDESSFGLALVISSLVGGVALMLVLSRQVVLPNLASAFWMLWLLPDLINKPSQIYSSLYLFRTGGFDGSHLVIPISVIIGGVALAIFAIRTVMSNEDRGTLSGDVTKSVFLMNVVVWPPFLAASAAGYLLMPLAFVTPDSFSDASSVTIYFLAMTALLIPVFVFGYRRYFAHKGVTLPLTSMLVLAVTQIVLIVGGEFVTQRVIFPVPLSGTTLLVLVAVGYALAEALRRPRSTVEA